MILDGIAVDCFEEPGWRCARISKEEPGTEYFCKPRIDQLAVIDIEKDTAAEAELWLIHLQPANLLGNTSIYIN